MLDRHLARLQEDVFERRGDYDTLWFEGRWYSAGELFERGCRVAAGTDTVEPVEDTRQSAEEPSEVCDDL